MTEKVLKTIIQVRRDTTENWELNKNVIPAEGEPCLDIDTGIVKYGDGVTTYANLKPSGGAQASHYEGVKAEGETDNDVIDRVLTTLGVKACKGDIFIVKTLIAEGKYSYTSFVYTGSVWAAMDGNYSAANVYFDRDLVTTAAIGNISLSNGQATVKSNGLNILETWDAIFLKEDTDISVTSPTVSLSGSVQYIEVGESSSQTISITYEDGSYEYGYTTETGETGTTAKTTVNNGTTGATATGYILKNGTTNISPTSTGGRSFAVSSGTKTSKASLSVKGSATHGAGYTPVSNLKKMYPDKAIKEGTTAEVSKELFRWYVPMYYGFKYSGSLIANPAAITESEVKGLTAIKDSTAYNATKPTSATATDSWRQFFVAVPSSYNAELQSIIDSNKLPLTIEKAANVNLTFGTTTIAYEVWYVNLPANYDTKALTLTW